MRKPSDMCAAGWWPTPYPVCLKCGKKFINVRVMIQHIVDMFIKGSHP